MHCQPHCYSTIPSQSSCHTHCYCCVMLRYHSCVKYQCYSPIFIKTPHLYCLSTLSGAPVPSTSPVPSSLLWLCNMEDFTPISVKSHAKLPHSHYICHL